MLAKVNEKIRKMGEINDKGGEEASRAHDPTGE